ncbi:hypothetical protein OsI_36711 [Oryza sativa Indica Group]|uniref:Uncharacterized protein n=1 Tax=Oryza sativa subsp. indica TaxID=39946 RepID=A2ZG10_ORYSI|nr:hypothetical protein OsI_36711 [Oryza sativa Indica Group]
MARDGREVEAAAPSGGRRIRPPERRGSRAGVRQSGGGLVRRLGRGSTSPNLVEAGSGGGGRGGVWQLVWEALVAGSGFPEARSGVQRSRGGRVRWPGRGSTSPDLVEAGSGGGGGGRVRQSVWEALAAGMRIHVPRPRGGRIRWGRRGTSPVVDGGGAVGRIRRPMAGGPARRGRWRRPAVGRRRDVGGREEEERGGGGRSGGSEGES